MVCCHYITIDMCPTGSLLMGGATPIPDSYITASSQYGTGSGSAPHQARLQNSRAWCPSTAEKDAAVPAMWLQVRATFHYVYARVFLLYDTLGLNDLRNAKRNNKYKK